jgi:hypothetical protein
MSSPAAFVGRPALLFVTLKLYSFKALKSIVILYKSMTHFAAFSARFCARRHKP